MADNDYVNVVYYIAGKQVRSAAAMLEDLHIGIESGVEVWVESLVEELHANTGAIWPYDTGASSRGFVAVPGSDGGWAFDNAEDYAVYVEAGVNTEGGYIVRLLNEREAQLGMTMQDELGRL